MPDIPEKTNSTTTDQIPADLQKLAVAVNSLPDQYAGQLAPLLDAVIESTKRRRRILTLVLEATRRERDDYRFKLDEQES